MRGASALRLALLAPLVVANQASAPRGRSPAAEVADTTVEIGRIFGQNGTDGLILYAFVLAIFLMFLVAIATAWFAFRTIDKRSRLNNAAFAEKDKAQAALTQIVVDALDRVAVAQNALAVSVAGDLQERQTTAATLARMEGTDQQLIALIERIK